MLMLGVPRLEHFLELSALCYIGQTLSVCEFRGLRVQPEELQSLCPCPNTLL